MLHFCLNKEKYRHIVACIILTAIHNKTKKNKVINISTQRHAMNVKQKRAYEISLLSNKFVSICYLEEEKREERKERRPGIDP